MPTINKPKKNYSRKKHGVHELIQKHVYSTARWRNLVKVKKMMNPLCERCLSQNRVKECEEIHHVTPLKTCNGDLNYLLQLAFDYDNLMALCCQCHEEIHAEMRAQHKRKITSWGVISFISVIIFHLSNCQSVGDWAFFICIFEWKVVF